MRIYREMGVRWERERWTETPWITFLPHGIWSNRSWFGAVTISICCLFWYLLSAFENGTCAQIETSFSIFSHVHLFLESWGVFLNTDKFLLHHAESEGREICFMLRAEMLGGVPGHIPRADWWRCCLLRNMGRAHPAFTHCLIMYLKSQMMGLSFWNIKPAGILLDDRTWIIYSYLNVKYCG